MNNARTRNRKRSTSEKRKRSTSRSKDDDLLIKALNQKVASDKQILISKDQYDELLSIRKQFKECQARAIFAETELARLQAENKKLECLKQQFLNPDKNNSLQNSLMTSNFDNQKMLENLKSSFSDIDQVLQLKSKAGKKYLTHTLKLTQEIEIVVSSLNISPKTKSTLLETISQISANLSQIFKIFTENSSENSSDPEAENIKLKKEVEKIREKSESYKESLARLQEQTKSLKKRLGDVENCGSHKKTIDDQENRIDLLEQEKELLSQHVKSLQSTLTEQCQIIGHLKDAFQALQLNKTENTTPTPRRTKEISLMFEKGSEEDYLQDEIENLDLEIQQLQQSLQKALSG